MIFGTRRRGASPPPCPQADPTNAPSIISLPLSLVQRILVSAGPATGGAVRSCRGLRDAWRAALNDPALSARFLISRHGRAGAALHAYGVYSTVVGNGSGGGGGGAAAAAAAAAANAGVVLPSAAPCLHALLRGVPSARHGDVALAFIRALAAEGALCLPDAAATLSHHRNHRPHDTSEQQRDPRPPHHHQQQHQEAQLGEQPQPQGHHHHHHHRYHQRPDQRQEDAIREGSADDAALVAVLRGAARCNHGPVVRELVAAGAPPQAMAAGLQAACWGGHLGLARELLQAAGLLRPAGCGASRSGKGGSGSGGGGGDDSVAQHRGDELGVAGATGEAVLLPGGAGPGDAQLAANAAAGPMPAAAAPGAEGTAAVDAAGGLPPQAPAGPLMSGQQADGPSGLLRAPSGEPLLSPPLLGPALTAASQGRMPRHLEMLALLLGAGADPRFNDGEALVRAAAAGSTGAVRLLLRAGADPRAGGCRPLVAAAEVLRVRIVTQLLVTRAYSYGDLAAVVRVLLVPPVVAHCASLAALLLPWLALAALLLTASAPLVFGCVLLCLWNGLWVVSALSVVGYGLGMALAAAAVGLAAGMALAAWATSVGLLLQFLLRALLRRTVMDGAAAAARSH